MKQYRVKNGAVCGKQIAEWLADALNGNDPKPTSQLCQELALCISPVLEYADILSDKAADDTMPGSSKKGRGRPVAAWHAPAKKIAGTIQHMMKNAGYRRRLRAADENSVAAIVGSKVISYAYCIEIQPRGFAQAMQSRDRRSKETRESDFFARYPGAKLIVVLPPDG